MVKNIIQIKLHFAENFEEVKTHVVLQESVYSRKQKKSLPTNKEVAALQLL